MLAVAAGGRPRARRAAPGPRAAPTRASAARARPRCWRRRRARRCRSATPATPPGRQAARRRWSRGRSGWSWRGAAYAGALGAQSLTAPLQIQFTPCSPAACCACRGRPAPMQPVGPHDAGAGRAALGSATLYAWRRTRGLRAPRLVCCCCVMSAGGTRSPTPPLTARASRQVPAGGAGGRGAAADQARAALLAPARRGLRGRRRGRGGARRVRGRPRHVRQRRRRRRLPGRGPGTLFFSSLWKEVSAALPSWRAGCSAAQRAWCPCACIALACFTHPLLGLFGTGPANRCVRVCSCSHRTARARLGGASAGPPRRWRRWWRRAPSPRRARPRSSAAARTRCACAWPRSWTRGAARCGCAAS